MSADLNKMAHLLEQALGTDRAAKQRYGIFVLKFRPSEIAILANRHVGITDSNSGNRTGKLPLCRGN
jgi:hypothetical protein